MSAFGIARALLVRFGQPWKRRRLERLYRPFVEPGDLCIDAGAGLGDRVGAFRALGARVVAVEPRAAKVAVLRQLYGADPEVTILPVGLGEAERDEVTTLDRVILQHGFPALVSVDADGADPEVVQGLGIAVAALSFGYQPAASARAVACVDRLGELGEYRFLASEAGTLRWEAPIDADAVRSWLLRRETGDPTGEIHAIRQDGR